jgi:hypothetical protein
MKGYTVSFTMILFIGILTLTIITVIVLLLFGTKFLENLWSWLKDVFFNWWMGLWSGFK